MSTSLARLDANRRNATRSTGPRTPRGKALSRRNAIRHGIDSCLPVLVPGQSRSQWDRFAAAIATDLQPVGPTESLLVAQVTKLQWRLLRSADARRTLARQQWREATLHAPQTAWWLHRRRTDQSLPASLDALRRDLCENRRCRELLAHLMASPDKSPASRPIKGQTAVELTEWAAAHLEVPEELDRSLDQLRHFPGLGTVDGRLEATLSHWTVTHLRHALAEVADWAQTTYDDLIRTLLPSMTDAWNVMRRPARRAATELRAFRRCAAARPTPESQQLDREEATLEHRLAQAMDQLQRLQARRRCEAVRNGSESGPKAVRNGPEMRQTPEKPPQIGFVSSEPLPEGYNKANAKCP